MAQGSTPILLSIHGKRLGIGQAQVGGVDGSAPLILDGNIIASPNPGDKEIHGSISLANGASSGVQGGNFYDSVSSGYTATAGGVQTSVSPVMVDRYNTLSTVATTSDCVSLPQATAANVGLDLKIGNEGAATAAIFPFFGTTDIINIQTSGVAFPLASSRVANFICTAVGKWRSVTSITS